MKELTISCKGEALIDLNYLILKPYLVWYMNLFHVWYWVHVLNLVMICVFIYT